MGLRCSVLGHAYEETEVEHDREERGNEVVITTQEYGVCTRCGERRLVSENKEVRSLDDETEDLEEPADGEAEPTPDEADRDRSAESPASEEPTGGRPSEAVADAIGGGDDDPATAPAAADDGTEPDDPATDPAAADDGTEPNESPDPAATDDSLDPADEDAEILTDEPARAADEDPGTAVEPEPGTAVEPEPGTAVESDHGTTVEPEPGAVDDGAQTGDGTEPPEREVPDDGGTIIDAEAPADDGSPADAGGEPDAGREESPTGTTTGETGSTDPGGAGSAGTGSTDPGGDDGEPTEADDEGIILEDDELVTPRDPADPDPERGYGQWPDDDRPEASPTEILGDADGSESTGKGPTDGEPTEPDAVDATRPEEADDTGTIIDAADAADASGSEPAASDESAPSAASEESAPSAASEESASVAGSPAGAAGAGAPASGGSDAIDTGFERAEEAPLATDPDRRDADTEFVCPACDHVVPATHASLRPGDICPECKKGYLAERERSP